MTCQRCDGRHETVVCPTFTSGKIQDIAILITILLQEYEIDTERREVRDHILETAVEIDRKAQS